MKRKILFLFVLMSFSIISQAKGKENRASNWYIMSGYGYSGMLGDMRGEGYSNVNTFLWQPKASWGFGLDYGMNFHNPVSSLHSKDMSSTHSRRHINFFAGPSVYWFPLNSERHRIHIGASVNYFYTDDYNKYKYFYPDTQTTIENYDPVVNHGFGLGASTGYSYKIGKHIELGARFYTSWSQEEFHLMGLINLAFAF